MRIKFNATQITKEATPQTFQAGAIYDLPEASAERWVRRGVAEYFVGEPEPPPATESIKPAPRARKKKK